MLDGSDEIGREALSSLGDAGNYRVVATFTSYDTLHAALRARKSELNVTNVTLDHVTGLATGHSSKLLAPKQIRRFGVVSLTLMLEALGLIGVLVEDRRLLRVMAPRLRTIARKPRAAKRREIGHRPTAEQGP